MVAPNAIERAIRHAEANDHVRRNVASLVRMPSGQRGRPSRSLTLDQAMTLMAAAEGSPLGAYVVLCLLTGIRNGGCSGRFFGFGAGGLGGAVDGHQDLSRPRGASTPLALDHSAVRRFGPTT